MKMDRRLCSEKEALVYDFLEIVSILRFQKHQTRLQELSIGCPSEKRQAVTHLYGRIEEFIHYLKTRMNRSQRIQGFFQSSQAVRTIILPEPYKPLSEYTESISN